MIRRLLLCCRGEIALRFIRTCRRLKIETAVVYSYEDEGAPFVLAADYSVCLSAVNLAGATSEVLAAAAQVGADAIAPGYGPLAENAEFAMACMSAGFIFVGPNPDAIRLTGDKARAREVADQAKVPIVPGGFVGSCREEAAEIATRIGYPIIVKAVMGGGGRGIRVVYDPDTFLAAFDEVRQEAFVTFGSADLYVERFLGERVRHVEVQLIGDKHGGLIHLGDRGCSVQRRRQKIAEEAPTPCLNDKIRHQLLNAALVVGRAVNYDSAGTVEFLVDDTGTFYFIEMNARIQVEHPVTEAISGIDIVEEIIRSAWNEPLRFRQIDIQLAGHAIEFRICAENPLNNFLPSGGMVTSYRVPEGPGIRIDSGIDAGISQSLRYDSLCAKVVIWGRDRAEALARSEQALLDFRLTGFPTNIPFHLWLLANREFCAGGYDLSLVSKFDPMQETRENDLRDVLVAAALANFLMTSTVTLPPEQSKNAKLAPWKLLNERLSLGYGDN